MIKVQVQEEDFCLNSEIKELTVEHHVIGAVVSFLGLCRDENATLKALEIECYPGMAEMEILRIAKQACKRWSLEGLTAIHRFGRIAPGENIVLVIAACKHREGAFNGAAYLMDFLKTQAPFWKREYLKDDDEGKWVSAREDDSRKLSEWEEK